MSIYPPNTTPALIGVLAQNALPIPKITLIDIGCSGGIDGTWEPYKSIVNAYGIDPLVAEIRRLQTISAPNYKYYDGFVVGPEIDYKLNDGQGWFQRVSALEAHRILNINYEQQIFNSGATIKYSDNKFTLDEFCARENIDRIDFIKSDTDGHDLAVLSGSKRTLEGALGVFVEATFSTEGGGAVFRDIDGLLSQSGFYLAGLRPIYYTRSVLPGRFYHHNIADEDRGACSWGEFLYLRDVVKSGPFDLESTVRLALITELYNLADVGAEALARFRTDHVAQVEPLLDCLVRYSGRPEAKTYARLIEMFRSEPRSFAP